MYVEECSDELWVGVKCQSNTEIAGSPRNAFRCSPAFGARGGRALLSCGGFTAYQRTAVRQWAIRFIVERETAQTDR